MFRIIGNTIEWDRHAVATLVIPEGTLRNIVEQALDDCRNLSSLRDEIDELRLELDEARARVRYLEDGP